MKATNSAGITLDRISTREELFEVMDLLCHSRLLTKPDDEAVGSNEDFGTLRAIDASETCEELPLDPTEEEGGNKHSNELSSLTQLLLGEFDWLN